MSSHSSTLLGHREVESAPTSVDFLLTDLSMLSVSGFDLIDSIDAIRTHRRGAVARRP